MKVIVVEDEKKAAKRLIGILKQLKPDIDILAVFETVTDSVMWLNNHPHPDLIFLDIQLADGLSFEIFNQVEILKPIIFITAFDEYAIEAFKVNSIDFILKPFKPGDIQRAITKYSKYYNRPDSPDLKNYIHSIQQIGSQLVPNYKNRFFVTMNNQAYSIPVKKIAYFIHEDKSVLLVNNTDQRYVINYTLDTLESLVDPTIFFRINRQFLIHIESILQIKNLAMGRISLDLRAYNDALVTVSRSKTQIFKKWLDQ